MTQTRWMIRLGFAATLVLMLLLGYAAWRESNRQEEAKESQRQEAVAEAIDLYAQHCTRCHGTFGEGLNLTPPLNADPVRTMSSNALFDTIAHGRTYTEMVAFAWENGGPLTNNQIEKLVVMIQSAPWHRVNARVVELDLVPEEDSLALVDLSSLLYPMEMIQAGRQLYQMNCASCHGAGSSAVQGNIIGKPLKNNEFVDARTDEELIAFIKEGRAAGHPDNTTGFDMPPFGGNPTLTDEQLGQITAYVRALNAAPMTEDTTASATQEPAETTAGEAYQWVQVVSNLDSPLNVVSAKDGTGRLFAVEQTGFILVIENGELLPEPFLAIPHLLPDQVYSGSYTEQGLLGLTFHPDYEENGQFFISYTDVLGDSVIARYQVLSDNPNRADPESAVVLLTQDQPFEDHNGGNIIFGPDGYLYIGFGDGGRPAEPNYNSQDPQTYLGKMLRIDVNADTYAVPDDNPFVDNPDFLPEIWAVGLRNPWRFSFDRETGDLWLGDVGQWLWEEVNFIPAGSTGGENYGWSAFEATHPYLADETPISEVTMPILEYTHDVGCSVTGGYVYRGEALLELQGTYLYGDYCSGRLWEVTRTESGDWERQLFMETDFVISSFGEDEGGELYLVDYKGAIYRLEAKPENSEH